MTLTEELALVREAILAILNRKGLKSFSARGRTYTSADLAELRAHEASLQRRIERARSGLVIHGTAERQG